MIVIVKNLSASRLTTSLHQTKKSRQDSEMESSSHLILKPQPCPRLQGCPRFWLNTNNKKDKKLLPGSRGIRVLCSRRRIAKDRRWSKPLGTGTSSSRHYKADRSRRSSVARRYQQRSKSPAPRRRSMWMAALAPLQ